VTLGKNTEGGKLRGYGRESYERSRSTAVIEGREEDLSGGHAPVNLKTRGGKGSRGKLLVIQGWGRGEYKRIWDRGGRGGSSTMERKIILTLVVGSGGGGENNSR